MRLDIITTTHRSTIFETHAFSFYSHLCIYRATYLHTVSLDWQQAVLEGIAKCAWKGQLSELGDTLRGHDQVSFEMSLEAVIERIWTYTPRL